MPSDREPEAGQPLFQTVVSSSLENVRLLADAACGALAPVLGDMDLIKVQIGLVEAANNVVKHACRDREDHTLSLSCTVSGGVVTLVLEDDGFPPAVDLNRNAAASGAGPVPDGMAESGRGLWLMRQCFASIRFESGNGLNRLFLRFEPEA
ncbi:ATP-binding protein [Azospirillum doebereinerae]|uniref:ATP-binding protein n=1 Tax=Azospirillum doebereinerae TaxID=92933 RepID=UPI001EE50CB1|nr:ATP-binding protein [Azospirillum doebereinerae]MCG5243547.1 ATP-binding protein [Azospirillum doebereinerae]